MAELEAQDLVERAERFGLITRDQAFEAIHSAEDGSVKALERSLSRRGYLNSWQLDKLRKGETAGFFYGGCRVLYHVAEGTFARVYRGVRESGGQPVAIKVLRQRFAQDSGAVQVFHNEAEAGLKLVHPNIVRIFEAGEQDRRHFMIMEYVEGGNLRDLLRGRATLSEKEALPLMLGLARGLKYTLDRGITHRDIKGTNILISSSGSAKLVDFGLATMESEEKKGVTNQRTVDYSALERTCGSPKGDPRSDIFFLGCVFYQMLTGTPPMPEVESPDPLQKMLKRSFNAIKPLIEHRLAPGPELCTIIERMMTVDLKGRYQSMAEVVPDLENYIAKVGAVAPQDEEEAIVIEEEEKALSQADDNTIMATFFGRGKAAEPEPAEEDHDDSIDLPVLEGEDASEAGKGEVRAFVQPKVLCVEVQEEIRNAFRKSFEKQGYRSLLFGDPEGAIERFRDLAADILVFDADGLGPEGLEQLRGLHKIAREKHKKSIPTLVLLSPKQKDWASAIPTDMPLQILVKPLKLKDITEAFRKLTAAS